MRLVFAGTPAAAVPALQVLLDSDHDVLAVVTRPDARRGRGRAVARSEVGQLADSAGVPVLTPAHPRDPDFVAALADLAPDAVPIVAYGALVPQQVLDIPRFGWINLHFSLLPAWRGAAPVQRAILAGDDITGATAFRLDAGMDTGPVFGVVTEEIRRTDTSGELLARLSQSGAGLLQATLEGIESGTIRAVAQPDEGVSLAPKLTVDDAHVDWSAPAARIDRLVRACTPAPGPWTTFRGERLKLGPITPLTPAETDALPSGVLRVSKQEVLVGTGSTPVRLGTVQAVGKRPMSAADWARGVRAAADEQFT